MKAVKSERNESMCLIFNTPIDLSDLEQMKRFLGDLDEWGLNYYFSSNIGEWMEIKGTKVIDEGGEKNKEYTIKVWGVNHTKALRSPAYWNSIANQKGMLVSPFVFGVGIAGNQMAVAVSRMFDQISLMWGHSFIEKSDLKAEPLYEGKEVYGKYTFGLVEDGCTHGTEPVIVLVNNAF